MTEISVSQATLNRLPVYLRYLQSLPETVKNISATSISKGVALGEVQVRKDLAAICGLGKPKTGYDKNVLIDSLETFMGFRDKHQAVMIGAGKLGRALLDYDFNKYGLEIVAAFDHNMDKFKNLKTNKPIYDVEDIDKVIKGKDIEIGIITVPSKAAQEATDMLVSKGIKAIWNFAPIRINVPDDVFLREESFASALANINVRIK